MVRSLWQLLLEQPANLTCDECFCCQKKVSVSPDDNPLAICRAGSYAGLDPPVTRISVTCLRTRSLERYPTGLILASKLNPWI